MNNNLESVFVEIQSNNSLKTKNVVVGSLYRPPNTDINEFNQQIESILHKLQTERKIVYFLGDWNIDALNAEKHAPSQDFLNMMYSFNLFPLCTKPTRVTNKSATLIDNIFTNNISESTKVITGILYSDISDHYPISYISQHEMGHKEEVHQKTYIFRLRSK